MNVPIRLTPVYKDYIWGGDRLKKEYQRADAPVRCAESWELSCLPGSESHTSDGKTLTELAAGRETDFFGTDLKGEFPLLVKLIDAKQDLSVQVHPSDLIALSERGEHGKAEMWYVLAAEEDASLYLGFSRELTPAELREKALDGTITEVLNNVPVKAGEAYFIRPGTVHAIRSGLLIAEIQQSSDTTFRLYDYGRLGTDGRPRELHLERAAAVADKTALDPSSCRAPTSEIEGVSELFSCEHFRVRRLILQGSAAILVDERSFLHLLCTEGSALLSCQAGEFTINMGESWFLPAGTGECRFSGESTLLLSTI